MRPQADEQMLQHHIERLQSSITQMTEHAENRSRLYVTDDDIAGLDDMANETVFAVKAPPGAELIVPDPDGDLNKTGVPRYRCKSLHNGSDAAMSWFDAAPVPPLAHHRRAMQDWSLPAVAYICHLCMAMAPTHDTLQLLGHLIALYNSLNAPYETEHKEFTLVRQLLKGSMQN